MKVVIYVEGGGPTRVIQGPCREGFSNYCYKVMSKRPQIIACGGRDQAYKMFKTAVKIGKADECIALLVDSEGPVGSAVNPADHLCIRDRWDFSNLPKDRVFLMVQAMEAWFHADRNAIQAVFKEPGKLAGSELNVEVIPKEDLVSSLEKATQGRYHKMRNAFTLLSRTDPEKVERASMHAAAFHAFLRSSCPS